MSESARKESLGRRLREWFGFASKPPEPAKSVAARKEAYTTLTASSKYTDAETPRLIYEATIRNYDILSDGGRNLESKGVGLVTLGIAFIGLIGTLLDKDLFTTPFLVSMVIASIGMLLASTFVAATMSLPNAFALPSPVVYNLTDTINDRDSTARIYASLAESWDDVSRKQQAVRAAKGRRIKVAFVLLFMGLAFFGSASSDALVERWLHPATNSHASVQTKKTMPATSSSRAEPSLNHLRPTPRALPTPVRNRT